METALTTIKENIIGRNNDGELKLTVYTDEKPTKENLIIQLNRLRNSFANVNDAFIAELSIAFAEYNYTRKQVEDMITHVIRTSKYQNVKISEVLASPNGIVDMVSGKRLMNRPTEEIKAEYYPICVIDGGRYYARKEDVARLSEPQKQILRKIYKESFCDGKRKSDGNTAA